MYVCEAAGSDCGCVPWQIACLAVATNFCCAHFFFAPSSVPQVVARGGGRQLADIKGECLPSILHLLPVHSQFGGVPRQTTVDVDYGLVKVYDAAISSCRLFWLL